VTSEAGIERIREKSLRLTSYLMYLADELLSADPYRFGVMTPRQPERRGGHVALTREHDALGVKEALGLRNVVADFRPPNVIRIAPSPLYSTFHEIWTVVRHVREIIEAGEQSTASSKRKPIN